MKAIEEYIKWDGAFVKFIHKRDDSLVETPIQITTPIVQVSASSYDKEEVEFTFNSLFPPKNPPMPSFKDSWHISE